MKKVLLTTILTMAGSAVALADGVLEMTGPDSAVAQYNDRCSNGANIVEATRNEFIKKMLQNPDSKLGKVVKNLESFDGDFQMTKGVLTKWVQTYHLRSGCGTNNNSFSAIIQSYDTMSNAHVTVTKFLVTVDDDDEIGTRTLKLRSIQQLNIRDEE